jgi:capsular polysaccharide biosynthesis protein
VNSTQPPTARPAPGPGVPAGAAFIAFLLRRWRFVAAQALAAVVVLVIAVFLTGRTTYDVTAHFILHPDPRSNTSDVANGISQLRQDGPLVQTVVRVLGNDEILKAAAATARVHDTSKYSVAATVSPGSSFFDVVVSGPDRRAAEALGTGLETVASAYVEHSYRGFKFDVLGSDETKHDSFPPSPSLVVLVLLLGAVAAAGELFVVFGLARVRSMVETAPVETAPVETAPVETAPVETAPVETASTPVVDRDAPVDPVKVVPVTVAEPNGATAPRKSSLPGKVEGSTTKAVRKSAARTTTRKRAVAPEAGSNGASQPRTATGP